MRFQKCEFCEQWDFRNVNFVKVVFSICWFLDKIGIIAPVCARMFKSHQSDESQARKIPQKCNFLDRVYRGTLHWEEKAKKGPRKSPWVKCRKWFWRNFLACKRNHNESFESLSKTSLHLSQSFTWCYSTTGQWSSSTFTNISRTLARKPTKCTTSCKHFKARPPLSLKPNAERYLV